MCPKYVICFDNACFLFVSHYTLGRDDVPQVCNLQLSSHLEGLSLIPACSSFCNMASSLMIWLTGSFKKLTISLEVYDAPTEVEVPGAGFH